jgi:hypothetical protein
MLSHYSSDSNVLSYWGLLSLLNTMWLSHLTILRGISKWMQWEVLLPHVFTHSQQIWTVWCLWSGSCIDVYFFVCLHQTIFKISSFTPSHLSLTETPLPVMWALTCSANYIVTGNGNRCEPEREISLNQNMLTFWKLLEHSPEKKKFKNWHFKPFIW